MKPGKSRPGGSPRLHPPSLRCNVTESKVKDIYVYDFRPWSFRENANTSTRRQQLLYFAGGGFKSPASKEHWKLCAELSTVLQSDYRVKLVSYPLAPNTPAPVALPMLRSLLEEMLRDGDLTLMGDSAGGNVVLTLAMWWASLPAAGYKEGCGRLKQVLVISPPTDLRNTNSAIYEADRHDPVLTWNIIEGAGSGWSGEWRHADPRISPLLNETGIEGLRKAGVKVHGVVGTYDMLAPDAIKFREACQRKGVFGEWLEWEKQMHCFPLTFAYGLPEGKKGVEWIVGVLKRNA